MITNVTNRRKIMYDPASGRDIREIKATRVFHISNTGTGVSADGIIASSVVGSGQNVVITGVGVANVMGASGTIIACITVGTSTLTPISVSSTLPGGYETILVSRNEPLAFATNTTIALRGVSAGVYAGWINGIIEPTIANVEV